MTLRDTTPRDQIETPQARVVSNAGGYGLDGCFSWTPEGWELKLQKLSFQELVRVVEIAKQTLER